MVAIAVIVVVATSLVAGIMILSKGKGKEGGYELKLGIGFSIRYPLDWRKSSLAGTFIYCETPDNQISFNVQIPTYVGMRV